MKRLLERHDELAAIEALLGGGGAALLIEGASGIGKTALIEAACRRAEERGFEVLRARGSELEAEFAFGVVRQLFEGRLTNAQVEEREALFMGPAAAVRPLVLGEIVEASADRSFAVLHGLYWLAVHLAAGRPLLVAVDDAHWTDEPSLRWLAYLVSRLEGLALGLLVGLRPVGSSVGRSLLALYEASAVVRPALLSEGAVAAMVRAAVGARASSDLCGAVWGATGGNPFYVTELLRSVEDDERSPPGLRAFELPVGGREGITRRVVARVLALGPEALVLAQALAVLGDGCELRHAAAIGRLDASDAIALASRLVGIEVLSADDPPAFLHPVVREALEASLGSDERDAAHRAAARVLHADGAPPGQVAAHLIGLRRVGDTWVVSRLREASRAALAAGAPQAAADLLERALAEPPSPGLRVEVLRESAHAEASAGRVTASTRLEETLRLSTDPRERAEIALQVAEVHAALFRWVDAVDVIEQALEELDGADEALEARLEGELVVCGLHDARRAARVGPVLARLSSRSLVGQPAEALAVAQGMTMVLAGLPANKASAPLEAALSSAEVRAESWDTRAALLWSLIAAERFELVETALGPMVDDVHRSGSARGFVAAYSTLGLLKLRLGVLPEAEAAARVALRVLQDGDFAPGLAFAATVLADVAVEAGDLDEAETLIALLPQGGWSAGVGTVLIPAARGRLRLAQGRLAESLADFQACAEMFDAEVWGQEMRDVGYLHARAGAAQALLRLGERERALEVAESELADTRSFGAPRALGIALRVTGLASGGRRGIELLDESVAVLQTSPALLERAHSLAELGAALRRRGRRGAAREPLSEALDLAARCAARPLATRVREELKAVGARPRREWRSGVEALTPSELRIVRLAAEGRSNREIAHTLYVTLKTVEGHLSRAYTKLGIDGRGELPQVLDLEKTRVAPL